MTKSEQTIHFGGIRHVVIECGSCGVFHTIPESKYNSCFREGGFWTCPNGHSRGWDKGQDARDRDELRLERDRLQQRTAQLQDEIRAQTKRAEEAEAKYLKTRRRAAAGVCSCCNRTFANVQRHMKTKHPNVVPLEQKQAS